MIIWVDDILSFSNSDAGNDQIKSDLKSKFEVNTIRNPSMILGIKLIQKENQILLSQTHFINSLLNKFGLENANPVTTPLDPNVNLDDNESEEDLNTQDNQASHSYATLIGSLMYLALGTRLDIAYAINRLAQFTQEPKLKHWTTIK
jgi:Reverse transcriptase (RNA-dependent DNA polymerase)